MAPLPSPRAAAACLVLAWLLSLGDLAWGDLAPLAYEELLNARAAVLVACGHAAELSLLQYRFFCGGCSTDAVVGAGFLRVLGPTELAWKLVPLLWQLLALASVLFLSHLASGRRGLLVAGALWLGAPTAWRELLLTGWGNHAESAAFTFGAAALLALSARHLGWAVLAGVVAGFGLHYAFISAHALPALVLGAVLVRGWRGGLGFGLGAPLGLVPWLVMELGEHGIFGASGRPDVPVQLTEMATAMQPSQPAGLLAFYVDVLRPGRLWWTQDGVWASLGSLVAVVVLVLGLLGAVLSLGRVRRGDARAVALILPALGLLGLVLATGLRHDLWADVPELLGYSPFLLRYRTPAFPLVVLGAALLAGHARLGGPATLLGLALGLGGVGVRMDSWRAGADRDLLTELPVAELTADPTIPGGSPPQRDARLRTRDVDVAAAEAFLATHTDALPICEVMHAVELERRRAGCRRPGCRE